MALGSPQKTAAKLVAIVLAMGGLAYASVPFYVWFCQVTGFGGTTAIAETGADEILDQTIKIRFDASLDAGMPWEFSPVVREMEVRIGETALAFYEAHNPTSKPIAGSSTFNVTPYQAGGFFTKIDCFCFEEQVLEPGERVQMPVSFYVDPEIVNDRDAKFTHTITLSYTFYEVDLQDMEEQATLEIEAQPSFN